MLACRLALKFALALAALFAQSAQAFIDPPRIVPTDPKPDEVVSVNIRSGVCDAVLNVQDVTRAGNTIRVLFFGVRYFDSELCNLQIDDTSFPIGSYPSGPYLVQADLMYGTVGGGTQIDPLGVVPFTIQSPATAVPAPINAPIALLVLGLGLLSLVAWKYRSRSGSPTAHWCDLPFSDDPRSGRPGCACHSNPALDCTRSAHAR
jgi:hypothetical protein